MPAKTATTSPDDYPPDLRKVIEDDWGIRLYPVGNLNPDGSWNGPSTLSGTVWLTAELSRKILNTFKNNRKPVKAGLSRLMSDLRTGNAYFSSDSLALMWRDILGEIEGINGQHRCLAVQRTNIPMPVMLSVFPEKVGQGVQDVTDQQIVRSLAHYLTIHGHDAHAQSLAATLRLLWWYVHREERYYVAPSNAQALALLRKYPDIEDVVEQHVRIKTAYLSPTQFNVAWYVLYNIDPTACEKFFMNIQSLRREPATSLAQDEDPCVSLHDYFQALQDYDEEIRSIGPTTPKNRQPDQRFRPIGEVKRMACLFEAWCRFYFEEPTTVKDFQLLRPRPFPVVEGDELEKMNYEPEEEPGEVVEMNPPPHADES